jgi:ABC-type uncharacterized transport system permease subunit
MIDDRVRSIVNQFEFYSLGPCWDHTVKILIYAVVAVELSLSFHNFILYHQNSDSDFTLHLATGSALAFSKNTLKVLTKVYLLKIMNSFLNQTNCEWCKDNEPKLGRGSNEASICTFGRIRLMSQ